MPKTLTCPGPPEHTFQHTGGRGRPPKFCPEHKPEKVASKPAPKTEPSVTHVTHVTDASSNPFIKKAQANPADNPFIKKAASATAVIEAEPESEKPEPKRKAEPAPPINKPARYELRTYEEVEDSGSYLDEHLPGVKIHSIRRDSTGVWYCQLTVNEETFNLIRRGGWMVENPSGGWRGALPHVAAAIQRRVWKLEPKNEDGKPKGGKKTGKIVEIPDGTQTATIVPPEEIIQICGICSTESKPGETWRLVDDMRLCPECAEELGEVATDQELEALDAADNPEPASNGYNDILSTPEMYDDPDIDKFSAILAEFDEDE